MISQFTMLCVCGIQQLGHCVTELLISAVHNVPTAESSSWDNVTVCDISSSVMLCVCGGFSSWDILYCDIQQFCYCVCVGFSSWDITELLISTHTMSQLLNPTHTQHNRTVDISSSVMLCVCGIQQLGHCVCGYQQFCYVPTAEWDIVCVGNRTADTLCVPTAEFSSWDIQYCGYQQFC